MSYSISVNGHKETSGSEESKTFEEEILAKAREFVSSLDGVSSASMSGTYIGSVNLTLETPQEETPR